MTRATATGTMDRAFKAIIGTRLLLRSMSKFTSTS